MTRRIDHDALADDLLGLLRRRGVSAAADLARELAVSQSTFSRVAASVRADLAVVGRGRLTRYAARRAIGGTAGSLPLYEIDERGGARRLAVLHAVEPRGFVVEAVAPDGPAGVFEDLPTFLNELRPAGFLGRLVPERHPELSLPRDIAHWTADHTVEYLARFGCDLPGSLILGDAAFQLHLGVAARGREPVEKSRRSRAYPRLAEDVMALGPPGSSAAGEQPKFLAWRAPGPVAVIVKFSPPIVDATSRRIADLLVAEHLALETLRACGHAAARSEIIRGGGRVFLEVERFDRVAGGGRRGVLSLFALDAEFVNRLESWSGTAEALARQGRLDAGLVAEVRWRELFGRLIANSDLHHGNLSLFTRGVRVVGLAPAYDMAPMAYYPQHGHLGQPTFAPVTPAPADGPVWPSVCAAATAFWQALARAGEVERGLRAIAARNARLVTRAAALAGLLPAQ
jgi:hypothetical protein